MTSHNAECIVRCNIADMVRCNISTMVRCNITITPMWSLCGATYLPPPFKQGGQYGAVQHNHNGGRVIVRCNIMPIVAMWLYGYAGARVARCEGRKPSHSPQISTPATFHNVKSHRNRFKPLFSRFPLSWGVSIGGVTISIFKGKPLRVSPYMFKPYKAPLLRCGFSTFRLLTNR
jgi:hypothetical protein